jgi:Spy/CpxP family protein refolding chaperone
MSRHGRTGWVTGLAVVVAMLGTLAAGVTYAHQGGGQGEQRQGRGMGPGMMMRDGGPMGMVRLVLGQLGLSDDQKQQVKTILGNHQADFQALREKVVPARRALADAIASGDEAAIRQHSTELSAVQTDMALLASKVHGEIFKILTPEQQQKAKDLRQKFESRMDQRRGRGPGKGPGRGFGF